MAIIRSNKDDAKFVSIPIEQGTAASSIVVFTTNPLDGNYIRFNGTQFTFRNSPSSSNDVQIGSDISSSIDNLLSENLPSQVTYEKTEPDEITITYKETGTVGNSWTIESNWIVTDPSLSGGDPENDWVQFQPIITTSSPIDILNSSTSTSLVTTSPVLTGDAVFIKEGTNVNVIENTLGTVQDLSHDFFGDGSSIATYRFDGNVIDSSGNYNGVWVGNEDYVSGVFGRAINLDGSSHVNIPNNFGNVFNYESRFTISCWLIGSGNISFQFTNALGNTGLNVRYFQDTNTGRIYVAKPGNTSGNRYEYYFPPGSYRSGDFLTIVKTDDETFDIYKNASLVETWSPVTNGVGNNTESNIGLGVGGTRTYGGYDQFRIFNRALSSSEVQSLYNESIPEISADISSFGISQVPSAASFASIPVIETSLEASPEKCLTETINPEIIGSATATSLTADLRGIRLLDENSLSTGDQVELQIGGSYTPVVLDSVTNGTSSTVDIHDVFNDGTIFATYQLETDASDLGGTNNGNPVNVTFAAGYFGQAAVFNGTDSVIRLPESMVQLEDRARTISMWTKLNSSSAGNRQMLYGSGKSGTTRRSFDLEANVYLASGKYGLHFWSAGVATEADVIYDQWVHLVVVHDGGGVSPSNTRIYVNNVPYSVTSNNSFNTSGAIFNAVGFRESQSDLPVDGQIDQIRLFNRALLSHEVNALYNESSKTITLSYPGQSLSPTALRVLSKSISSNEESKVWNNDHIEVTYPIEQKQGRALQYEINSSRSLSEITQVKYNLWT